MSSHLAAWKWGPPILKRVFKGSWCEVGCGSIFTYLHFALWLICLWKAEVPVTQSSVSAGSMLEAGTHVNKHSQPLGSGGQWNSPLDEFYYDNTWGNILSFSLGITTVWAQISAKMVDSFGGHGSENQHFTTVESIFVLWIWIMSSLHLLLIYAVDIHLCYVDSIFRSVFTEQCI